MLKLIGEKLRDGTLLQAVEKTIKGKFGAFKKWVRHHDSHYFLDAKRVFTKELLAQYPPVDGRHVAVGNYFLDKRIPLDASSVVYSVGILTEISFDVAVAQRFDSQVFMYDPTPVSVAFMEQYKGHRNFKFFPYGVWVEDTVLKFYLPNDAGSASILSGNGSEKYFEATCKTLKTLMATNLHARIDVLKMDIEGAALPIMEQMIAQHIFPNQIVVELERPLADIFANIDFFHRVVTVCKALEKEGYEIFSLPRTGASYFSMELLFSKKTAQR
jgi:FkbM family methyltransferase